VKPPYPPKPKCTVCGIEIAHTAKSGLCARDAREAGIKNAHAPTSEERSRFRLCGARKKNGSRCRAFAGQGTEHPGHGPCKLHGGATPAANKSALVAKAKADMVRLGAPINKIEPHEALAGLLRISAGHVTYLHSAVGAIEDVSDPECRVLIDLYDAERDRFHRVAQACVSAGIAERHVRIEEAKVIALGQALSRAAKVAGLDDGQRRRLGAALRKELSKLSWDSDSEGGIWAPPGGNGLDANEVINGKAKEVT
jgi:hypothetical protein